MNKKIILSILLLVVIVFLSFYFLKYKNVSETVIKDDKMAMFLGKEVKVNIIDTNKLASIVEPSNLDTGLPAKHTFLFPTKDALASEENIVIQTSGNIPEKFKQYVKEGVLMGISGWEKDYGKSFSLEEALAGKTLKVVLNDNINTFKISTGGSMADAFVDVCQNDYSNENSCEPVIYIYFNSDNWNESAYHYFSLPKPRLAHEIFHIGHFYLLASKGSARLFTHQKDGMSWQKESFAVLSSRFMPYDLAYKEYGDISSEILSKSFLSFTNLTDLNHPLSYGVAPLVDQLIFRVGDDKNKAIEWLNNTYQDGYGPIISLMRALSDDKQGSSDTNIAPFQDAYRRAMIDLYFPGVLGNALPVNTRTVGVLDYASVKKETNLVKVEENEIEASIKVPTFSAKILTLPLTQISEVNESKKISLKLSTDSQPLNIRALVLAVAGNNADRLASCYKSISATDESEIKSLVSGCVKKNSRIVAMFNPGDKESVIVSTLLLKELDTNLDNISLVALVMNTISDTSLDLSSLVKSINVKLNASIQKKVSTFKGGGIFPSLDVELNGGEPDYTSFYSACFVADYPYEPAKSGVTKSVKINSDLDSGTFSAIGTINNTLLGQTCNINISGRIDADTKFITGKMKGSVVINTTRPSDAKTFGTAVIKEGFEGDVSLGKFRESTYMDPDTQRERVSWIWRGNYDIKYTSADIDKSGVKGTNFSQVPKRGTREQGSLSIDGLVSY